LPARFNNFNLITEKTQGYAAQDFLKVKLPMAQRPKLNRPDNFCVSQNYREVFL
jgi:hypothetical protein